MRQFDEGGSTLISIVSEALGKIEAILAEAASNGSSIPDGIAEAIASINGGLRDSVDVRPLQGEKASRAADLATVVEHGGFDDERTAFMFYLLFKEFGPDLLSDAGLRRLADCMRDPVAACA